MLDSAVSMQRRTVREEMSDGCYAVCSYKGRSRDGPETWYDANGRIIAEQFYLDGDLHGMCTQWLAVGGGLSYRGNFIEGCPEGLHESYFDVSGLPRWRQMYDAKGHLHGLSYMYNERGELSEEIEYADGEVIAHRIVIVPPPS